VKHPRDEGRTFQHRTGKGGKGYCQQLAGGGRPVSTDEPVRAAGPVLQLTLLRGERGKKGVEKKVPTMRGPRERKPVPLLTNSLCNSTTIWWISSHFEVEKRNFCKKKLSRLGEKGRGQMEVKEQSELAVCVRQRGT